MPGHALVGRIAAGSVTVLPMWCHRDNGPGRASPARPEERRAAAELLAALADWNPEALRRAAIGETVDGSNGRALLLEAVEVAEDERG
jgi:hypothetical protein